MEIVMETKLSQFIDKETENLDKVLDLLTVKVIRAKDDSYIGYIVEENGYNIPLDEDISIIADRLFKYVEMLAISELDGFSKAITNANNYVIKSERIRLENLEIMRQIREDMEDRGSIGIIVVNDDENQKTIISFDDDEKLALEVIQRNLDYKTFQIKLSKNENIYSFRESLEDKLSDIVTLPLDFEGLQTFQQAVNFIKYRGFSEIAKIIHIVGGESLDCKGTISW